MVAKNTLGIDYHLRSVRVCVLSEDGRKLGNRSLKNSVSEVLDYARRFGEVSVGAVEVSCGAAAFVDSLRAASGWDIRLCHPGYVNRMKSNPDKSDKADAELLADLCRVGYLPEVWLAPERIRDLRQLVRFRCQGVERRKSLKLRIRATLRHFRIRTPERFNLKAKKSRAWLVDAITNLPEHSRWVMERSIAELAYAEECIQKTEERLTAWANEDGLCSWLMKQRGIGVVIATLLRAEIGTVTRFRNGKQLARFCGLTPRNASSGERQAESGLIKAGNPQLKCAIMQAAHLLRRLDPHWRSVAARLSATGKHSNVCVAAIANRWIRRLYHQMREFELENLRLAA